MNFCDKIRRVHKIGKIQNVEETELSEEKL